MSGLGRWCTRRERSSSKLGSEPERGRACWRTLQARHLESCRLQDQTMWPNQFNCLFNCHSTNAHFREWGCTHEQVLCGWGEGWGVGQYILASRAAMLRLLLLLPLLLLPLLCSAADRGTRGAMQQGLTESRQEVCVYVTTGSTLFM